VPLLNIREVNYVERFLVPGERGPLAFSWNSRKLGPLSVSKRQVAVALQGLQQVFNRAVVLSARRLPASWCGLGALGPRNTKPIAWRIVGLKSWGHG
jgi:hypothetical protein